MASKTFQVIVVGDSTSGRKALADLNKQAALTESGLSRVGARMTAMGGTLSRVGGTLTRRVTLPIGLAAAGAIKLASDAEETRNRVDVVFGDMSESVIGWSNTTIDSMGAANFTAQDMASTFGLLFKSAGLADQELATMSTTFGQLTGDASSFFNVPLDEALQKIRSGLTGEAEPMRDFGVFLSEAAVGAEALALGLAKEGDELTEQQKIMARASLITKGMSDAQGDFERTSSSAANQTKQTVERLKELGAEVGKELIPVFVDLVGGVQDVVGWFSDLDEGTRSNILKALLLAAAVGPVLKIFGGLLTVGGKLVGLLPRIAAGFGGVAATSAASGTQASAAAGAFRAAGSGLVLLSAGIISYLALRAQLDDMADSLVEGFRAGGTAAQDAQEKLEQLQGRIDELGKSTEIPIFGFDVGPRDVPGLNIIFDALDGMEHRVAQAASDMAQDLGRLPGALTPARKELLATALAAGDYATAFRYMQDWENQWLRQAKESQAGMGELTTEMDRNTRSADAYIRARERQQRQDAKAREGADALSAGVRSLATEFDNVGRKNPKPKVESPGLDALSAGVRSLATDMDFLDGKDAKPKVEVPGLKERLIDLGKLKGALEDIPGTYTATIDIKERIFRAHTQAREAAAASGFRGTVRQPTMFLVGEGGEPEDVLIVPHSDGGIRTGRDPGAVEALRDLGRPDIKPEVQGDFERAGTKPHSSDGGIRTGRDVAALEALRALGRPDIEPLGEEPAASAAQGFGDGGVTLVIQIDARHSIYSRERDVQDFARRLAPFIAGEIRRVQRGSTSSVVGTPIGR